MFFEATWRWQFVSVWWTSRVHLHTIYWQINITINSSPVCLKSMCIMLIQWGVRVCCLPRVTQGQNDILGHIRLLSRMNVGQVSNVCQVMQSLVMLMVTSSPPLSEHKFPQHNLANIPKFPYFHWEWQSNLPKKITFSLCGPRLATNTHCHVILMCMAFRQSVLVFVFLCWFDDTA
jgi:hypothetical protein